MDFSVLYKGQAVEPLVQWDSLPVIPRLPLPSFASICRAQHFLLSLLLPFSSPALRVPLPLPLQPLSSPHLSGATSHVPCLLEPFLFFVNAKQFCFFFFRSRIRPYSPNRSHQPLTHPVWLVSLQSRNCPSGFLQNGSWQHPKAVYVCSHSLSCHFLVPSVFGRFCLSHTPFPPDAISYDIILPSVFIVFSFLMNSFFYGNAPILFLIRD